MPRYYRKSISDDGSGDEAYTPRIQQAMDDAIRYATPRVNEGETSFTGGREGTMGPEGRSFEGDIPDDGYMINDVPGAMSGKPMDKVKYYNRLESNLRNIGDVRGVEVVQKEREDYLSNTQKISDEADKRSAGLDEKKRKAGDEKLRYFGSLAKKNLDILKSQGQDAANQYFQNAQSIALDAGMISPEEQEDTFDPGKAQVVADHWDKTYGWKEDVAQKKAEKAGGKGGTPTSFNQIVDKLRRELNISGEPLIKMAREVYSEGKYNRNAAAVSLIKGGMSEEKAQRVLDKLEGKETPAPAKMKVPKNKVKFLD